MTLKEIERRLILKRLKRYGGDKNAVAESLGVHPDTLRDKLHRYGLAREWALPSGSHPKYPRTVPGEKTCTRCLKSRPLGEFPPSKHAADGHRSACRECTQKYNREYQRKRQEGAPVRPDRAKRRGGVSAVA